MSYHVDEHGRIRYKPPSSSSPPASPQARPESLSCLPQRNKHKRSSYKNPYSSVSYVSSTHGGNQNKEPSFSPTSFFRPTSPYYTRDPTDYTSPYQDYLRRQQREQREPPEKSQKEIHKKAQDKIEEEKIVEARKQRIADYFDAARAGNLDMLVAKRKVFLCFHWFFTDFSLFIGITSQRSSIDG